MGHGSEDEDEVEPGEEHCKGSHLPLPSGSTPAIIKVKNEYDGQYIQGHLKVVGHIPEVLQACHNELPKFIHDSSKDEDVQDGS